MSEKPLVGISGKGLFYGVKVQTLQELFFAKGAEYLIVYATTLLLTIEPDFCDLIAA
ncbi:MAG: hypothetical protein JJU46_12515 [Balneolaceae bacterium]|nr:hypothetical protein [Balneolaceae bacterium]MCH8547607.1 hypothetical protein [Balneolaceae bacterium]